MGALYLIYTEARIDDEWVCIDGYYETKSIRTGDKHLSLAATYENGSRSCFGSTYDELRHIGEYELFSNLSSEIKKQHSGLKYKYDLYMKQTDEEESYLVIPYNLFLEKCPNVFSKHGIIHKDTIFAFEHGEIDDLYTDDEIDFSKMTELERQVYRYYEWDDLYDWPHFFKEIKKCVEHTIDKYMMNSWALIDRPEVRLVCFEL